MSSSFDEYDGNTNIPVEAPNPDGRFESQEEGCDQTNASATVTLPLEEVLRLTSPEDEEFASERSFRNVQNELQSQYGNKNLNNTKYIDSTRSTSKSPKPGKKKTKKIKRDSKSSIIELKRAIKNEKKSVDKVVAAAIQKYEESPSSLQKTRVTPKRTKSGSSVKKKKKVESPIAANHSNSNDPAAKKEDEKQTVIESLEKAQSKALKFKDARVVSSPTEDVDASVLQPLHGVGSLASLQSIEKAGAIAVFPTDSEHHTRRRSVTNPNRISDIDFDVDGMNDVEAQNQKGNKKQDLDSTLTNFEEIPEPPKSQVIHAVATYSQQQKTVLRSSQTEGTFGSSSGDTAPTISLSSTNQHGYLDSESGTVTAKAISSENYYEEVRRQLQKEAIAAVAVVPLNDDGQPIEKEKNGFDKSTDKDGQDDRKSIRKYALLGCVLAVFVIILVVVFATYRRKLRRIGQEEEPRGESFEACEGDMDCFMDLVMNSDLGLYWRQRITKILPRSTLEKLLQDSDFSSPHHKAFYFLIKNAENLYGVDNMVDMLNEELDSVEKIRVNAIFGLVTLYEATKGDNWYVNTNWLRPEIDICEWHGVNCQGEVLPKDSANVPTTTTTLDTFPSDNFAIAGPPPGDLEDDTLTDEELVTPEGFPVDDDDANNGDITKRNFSIHNLELQANNLKGTIPDDIITLSTMLGLFDLSMNEISGTIPTDLYRLSFLRGFDVHSNQLESTIPTTIAKMVNLRLFDISYNEKISGAPIRFDYLQKIENLQLQGTNIIGAVGDSVCDMLEERATGVVPFVPKFHEKFIFRASCPDKLDCPCCTECCDENGVCVPNVV